MKRDYTLPISIHAPHAGSDRPASSTLATALDFNPRSPCGERHDQQMGGISPEEFQSTLPMRGATTDVYRHQPPTDISIHAPHAGSDLAQGGRKPRQRDFNPRSPCGERRKTDMIESKPIIFQSTLPMRGATRASTRTRRWCIFQSTLPMRGATPQTHLT